MPGTVLDAGEAADSRTNGTSCFHGANVLVGRVSHKPNKEVSMLDNQAARMHKKESERNGGGGGGVAGGIIAILKRVFREGSTRWLLSKDLKRAYVDVLGREF